MSDPTANTECTETENDHIEYLLNEALFRGCNVRTVFASVKFFGYTHYLILARKNRKTLFIEEVRNPECDIISTDIPVSDLKKIIVKYKLEVDSVVNCLPPSGGF